MPGAHRKLHVILLRGYAHEFWVDRRVPLQKGEPGCMHCEIKKLRVAAAILRSEWCTTTTTPFTRTPPYFAWAQNIACLACPASQAFLQRTWLLRRRQRLIIVCCPLPRKCLPATEPVIRRHFAVHVRRWRTLARRSAWRWGTAGVRRRAARGAKGPAVRHDATECRRLAGWARRIRASEVAVIAPVLVRRAVVAPCPRRVPVRRRLLLARLARAVVAADDYCSCPAAAARRVVPCGAALGTSRRHKCFSRTQFVVFLWRAVRVDAPECGTVCRWVSMAAAALAKAARLGARPWAAVGAVSHAATAEACRSKRAVARCMLVHSAARKAVGMWAFFLVVAHLATDGAHRADAIAVICIVIPRASSCIELLVVTTGIGGVLLLIADDLDMTGEIEARKCAWSRLAPLYMHIGLTCGRLRRTFFIHIAVRIDHEALIASPGAFACHGRIYIVRLRCTGKLSSSPERAHQQQQRQQCPCAPAPPPPNPTVASSFHPLFTLLLQRPLQLLQPRLIQPAAAVHGPQTWYRRVRICRVYSAWAPLRSLLVRLTLRQILCR